MASESSARDDPPESFSKKPVLSPNCSWKPPECHPNLEVSLSQIENELFKMVGCSNLFKKEWEAVRCITEAGV